MYIENLKEVARSQGETSSARPLSFFERPQPLQSICSTTVTSHEMNDRLKHCLFSALFLASFMSVAPGCSGDPEPDETPSSTTSDMGMNTADQSSEQDMNTTPAEDMGSQPEDMTSVEADMPPEEDQGMPVDMADDSCPWPEFQIAGTPETDNLAMDAARCGQPDHAWITDSMLGTVTSYGDRQDISKALLQSVLDMENTTLPEPLQYNTRIQQFAYMTQDRGELIEATALIGTPRGAEQPRGVILVLHGTTGFTDDCAPSRSLEGAALVALFASLGYMAIAPDYIGMKGLGDRSPEIHPYLAGQATAIASLDAVRAAQHIDASRRSDLCPGTDLLVFGGSQGGHAALWVDRLQPYYAREMKLLGTVATVPPMDLLAQLTRALQEEVNATANSIAFFGAAASWYGASDRLNEVFESPYDTRVPEVLYGGCDFSDLTDGDLSIETLFTPEIIDAAATQTLGEYEPWGCMARENSLTDTSIARIQEDDPSYGILLVFGEEDNLVHTPIERAAYPSLCEGQEMPTQYIECAGAGHGPATFYALPEILGFLDDRINGRPFTPSCEAPAPVVCQGTPQN